MLAAITRFLCNDVYHCKTLIRLQCFKTVTTKTPTRFQIHFVLQHLISNKGPTFLMFQLSWLNTVTSCGKQNNWHRLTCVWHWHFCILEMSASEEQAQECVTSSSLDN